MQLEQLSRDRLAGVHPDLVMVVARAGEMLEIRVTEGLRTRERQQWLYDNKRSRTLNSRHLTGHAVDVVRLFESGRDVSYHAADMAEVARVMKQAADEMQVPIEWGGDWKGFQDTPHFQLPWNLYPAETQPILIDVTATEVPPEAAQPARGALGPAPVREAVQRSRTLTGLLMTSIGFLLSTFEAALQLVIDAGAELARVLPALSGLGLDPRAAGWGLAVGGIALAVFRRLDAARKGKIG